MAASARGLLFLLELEADAVHAVAQSRGLGPVVEDVAQVSPAARAKRFRAAHEEAVVRLGRDVVLNDRLEEAGPARAGIELGLRAEEVQAAAGALVGPLFLIMFERARESPFRTFLPGDFVLLGRQDFSPFFVGLGDFFAHREFLSSARRGNFGRRALVAAQQKNRQQKEGRGLEGFKFHCLQDIRTGCHLQVSNGKVPYFLLLVQKKIGEKKKTPPAGNAVDF